MNWQPIFLALAFALRACDPAEATPPTEADGEVAAILDGADFANRQRNFPATVTTLTPVIDGELYGRLSPLSKYRADTAYGLAALQLRMHHPAHQAWVRATMQPMVAERDWDLRFVSAQFDHDFVDAFQTFTLIHKNWPFTTLGDGEVSGMEQGLGTLPDGGTMQLSFEQYLEQIEWTPADPFFSKAVIWYHQAANLLEHGDTDRAYAVAERIHDPFVLTILQADRRFDTVVASNPTQFEAQAAAERLLSETREISNKDPDWVEARTAVASRLYLLGRMEDALSEVNAALAKGLQLPPAERRRYAGLGRQLDHALLVKSFLLFGLGRHDEALGIASTIGSARTNRPDTNEALVLGKWLLFLGRPKESLEQLVPVSYDDLRYDGQAELAYLRACAANQTGDRAIAEENLSFLREHVAYGPSDLLHALICRNNLEEAAAAVQKGLADPRLRMLFLQQLQVYKPEKGRTAFQIQMDRRLDELRSRRDVAASISRIGRINRYDLVSLGPLY